MKTFADIKRALTEGAILTMTRHDWFPDGPLINKPRKIIKRQSNAIQFEGGSWLNFPPASDICVNDNGFSVLLSVEKAQFMTYEFKAA
jgi:hypothetical protein